MTSAGGIMGYGARRNGGPAGPAGPPGPPGPAGPPGPRPPGWMWGLEFAAPGLSVLGGVAPGEAYDDTNTVGMRTAGGLPLDMNIVGAGGRDAGALAGGFWDLWMISDVTGTVCAALASSIYAAPVMPLGFTQKRRIGSFLVASTGFGLSIPPTATEGDTTARWFYFTKGDTTGGPSAPQEWYSVFLGAVPAATFAGFVLGTPPIASKLRCGVVITPTAGAPLNTEQYLMFGAGPGGGGLGPLPFGTAVPWSTLANGFPNTSSNVEIPTTGNNVVVQASDPNNTVSLYVDAWFMKL